jgi:hypothetical protein
MSTVKNTRGTLTEAIATASLNSMANNTNVLGSAISLTTGEPGYRFCEAELLVTFGTNPTANTSFCCWLLREVDGTNYEDGGASVTPTRPPDLIFTVRAVTTAQRILAVCDLPPGTVKALLRNDGTGQAIAASGNTLKIRPLTESF